MDQAREIVDANNTLCLDLDKLGWDDARGYFFDKAESTLYFKVSPKYLEGQAAERFQVLIWSTPRVRVQGRLVIATSEGDMQAVVALASATGRFTPDEVDYMFFDQRSHKPRRGQYKLLIDSMEIELGSA